MSHLDRTTLDVAHRIVAICDVLNGLAVDDAATFTADVRSQWAVGMGLIRIGETVNRLPLTAREEFDGQPWRRMIGLRNVAAHQYEDLSLTRVWATARHDVPALRAYLTEIVIPTVERRVDRPDLA